MQLYPLVKKEGGIAIAEKPVTVPKGMRIACLPVVTDHGGNQQQQSALRHVKVCKEPREKPEAVSRNDHELGLSRIFLQVMRPEIPEEDFK